MIHIEKSRAFGIGSILCEMCMAECSFDCRHAMTMGSMCENEQYKKVKENKLKFGKLQNLLNRFVDL